MKDELISKLLDYLQKTEDFALQQMPDVILQALRYEKISNFCSIFLMFFFLALAGIVIYYSWTHPCPNDYESRSISSWMGMYIPSCISAFFIIQICICIDRLIKIYFAPKYFLIELIKGFSS